MSDLTSNEASARLAAEPKPPDHQPWPDNALEGSMADRFDVVARSQGWRDAIRTDLTSLTYDELRGRVNGLAHAIDAATPVESAPVLVAVSGDVAPSVGAFAVWAAGMIHVPVDGGQPLGRLQQIAEDAGAVLVVCDTQTEPAASRLGIPVVSLDDVEVAPEPPDVSVEADQACRILYTSGSTGRPKGVTRSHRELLASIQGVSHSYGITPRDRIGMVGPSTFSGSISDMLLALLNGACLLPFDVKRRGLVQMRAWLEHELPSTFYIVPSFFRALVRVVPDDVTFTSVEVLRFGAEALLSSDVEAARLHLSPDAYIVNNLGATEIGVYARYVIDRHTEIATPDVPAGYPVTGRKLVIVDDEGDPLPAGERGHIVVDCASRSRYWNDDDGTDRAFASNGDGSVSYHTGDRGYVEADGLLHYLGRSDRLVKVHGNRVETGEVESALSSLAGVDDVAVAGLADDGVTRLVAYVVAKRRSGLDSAAVRAGAAELLPDYAVPSQVELLESLPRTDRGKVDWGRLTSISNTEAGADDAADNADIVEQLQVIWSATLGVESVGVDDDFFDIGGTSIEAIAMFARVDRQLGHDLAPTTLLRAPTVAALAEVIASGAGGRGDHSLVPLREHGSKTPLFCVHGGGGGIFFVGRMMPHVDADRPLYGLQAAGFEGTPPPFRTVEEMAARYVDELRHVQPVGPYALAGMSLGGAIAWEMACRLAEDGERVDLLGMIDTKPLELFNSATRRGITAQALGIDRIPSTRLVARVARRLLRFVRGCILKVWLTTGRPLPDRFRLRNSYFWPLHAKAAREYEPPPFAGDVTIVSERGATETHREIWAERCQSLEVVELSAHHLELGDEPHIGEIVTIFERRLAARQRDLSV